MPDTSDTATAAHVLLVSGPRDESYDPPEPFGPFATVEEAQVFAEDFREANGLPREATEANNEEWTEAGWYFGIFELSRGVECWV